MKNGGEGGIRTHGGLAPTPVFKTGAFDHSATSPWGRAVRLHIGSAPDCKYFQILAAGLERQLARFLAARLVTIQATANGVMRDESCRPQQADRSMIVQPFDGNCRY